VEVKILLPRQQLDTGIAHTKLQIHSTVLLDLLCDIQVQLLKNSHAQQVLGMRILRIPWHGSWQLPSQQWLCFLLPLPSRVSSPQQQSGRSSHSTPQRLLRLQPPWHEHLRVHQPWQR
jgi:hypothetical protein